MPIKVLNQGLTQMAHYTGDSSEFNDVLAWNITPASGTPVSGSVNVNSRHSAWENGIELNGFDPVCLEGFYTLTAPPGAPMTVTVHLTAKNVSDGVLPSTVMVGVMGFDLDVDSDHDGDIDASDDAAEETDGGIVVVGAEALTPLNIAFAPEGLGLGALKLEAVSGGDKITLRSGNSTNSAAVTLPKTWASGESVPSQLWVQGLTPSDVLRDVSLRLSFSVQGETCEDTVNLTVVKVKLEPVTTEVNAQGLILNPCGVAANGLAMYRVGIEPTAVQDEDIQWSVASGGVTFYGGHDTGREVTIRGGASESDFKLEVQIGDLPESSRPYIYGRVLEPRTVQVRAYVICDANGVEAVSENTIAGWIDEANRVYRQVAVTFTLEGINTIMTRPDWFEIDNSTGFYDMTSYTNNTGGLELYCVGSMYVPGLHSAMTISLGDSRRGMAVEAGASLQTLVHEIGHAFGLSDMYKYDAGDGLVSLEKTYPLNWSGGNGTGYYSPTLTYRDLTYRVIMHNHNQTDIPLYYLSGMCESIRVQISVGLPTMATREPLH